jgi:hypothetical protein
MNALEQFYIVLFNYQNKLIPELQLEDRYPLFDFDYDLQLQHVTTRRAANLLRTTCLPFSASERC